MAVFYLQYMAGIVQTASTKEASIMGVEILSRLLNDTYKSGAWAMAKEIHVPTELIGSIYTFPAFDLVVDEEGMKVDPLNPLEL